MPPKPVAVITAALAAVARQYRMPLGPLEIRLLAKSVAQDLARPPAEKAPVQIPSGDRLSEAHVRLLRLRANGFTLRTIAQMERLSLEAVKSRQARAVQLLGAVDVTQAVAVAFARQLLGPAQVHVPAGVPRRKPGPRSAA